MLIPLAAIGGCGDGPLRSTALPNGYSHSSNAGHFGKIIKPANPDEPHAGRVVVPRGAEYCNEFGWSGDFVVGVAERPQARLVDPVPEGDRRYFILDTTTEALLWFDVDADLGMHWGAGEYPEFPVLRGDHPETVRDW